METAKRALSLLFALVVLAGLTACGQGTERGRNVNNTVTVRDLLSGGDSSSAGSGPKSAAAASRGDGLYDVDLTVMNSTMVYSEVLQMMQAPEGFLGKRVKMAGTLAIYEGKDRNYYACLIADATACCAQGIEFLWAGDHAPEDYPPYGAEITVTGIFDTYQEGAIEYCQLIDAELYY